MRHFLVLVIMMLAAPPAFCYDIHITRAKVWSDSAKKPITEAEWTRFVKTNREFRFVPEASTTNPKTGEVIRIKSKLLALWQSPDGKARAYFDYFRGQIVVSDPTPAVLQKMRSVAASLHAALQGDEGEDI